MSALGKIATVALGLLLLVVLARSLWEIYKHGRGSRFISDISPVKNGMFMMAIMLASSAANWLKGGAFWSRFWEALPFFASMFAFLAVIWLAGFFVGRFRGYPDDGVIKR